MAFFSIISPVYKTEAYLPACAESLFRQSFHDFEWILVDDGSPDGAGALCDGIAEKDARVKVLHRANGGAAAARNAGIRVASGGYLLFLDSDDTLDDPEALAILSRRLASEKADVFVLGITRVFEESGKRVPESWELPENFEAMTRGERLLFLMRENVFYSGVNKILRRDFLLENGLFFPEGTLCEDVRWCCDILRTGCLVSAISEKLYCYRRTDGSTSAHPSAKQIEAILATIEDERAAAEALDPRDGSFILSYLANQYALLLLISNAPKQSEIKSLLPRMKKHYDLLGYSLYPYVRRVRPFRFLGFGLVRRLLGVYGKICRLV